MRSYLLFWSLVITHSAFMQKYKKNINDGDEIQYHSEIYQVVLKMLVINKTLEYIYFTMPNKHISIVFFVSLVVPNISQQSPYSIKRDLGTGWSLLFAQPLCLSLYIIKIMRLTPFLLLLLVTVSSQIVKQVSTSLAQLSQANSTLDIFQARAIRHLLQSHPELATCKVTNIHTQLDRGDQNYASNLKDFLFELVSDQKKLRALVTLSNEPKKSYVTLGPIVSSNPPTANAKYKNFAEYSIVLEGGNKTKESLNSPIMNQAIYFKNNNLENDVADPSPIEKPPLNGYIQYTNNDDPIVQFALDFVASQHPNIVNYDNQSIAYQLVAGLNVKIHYVGDDRYTKVSAVVNFDLKLRPKIIGFEVDCVQDDEKCNPMTAWSVYQSLQSTLIFHPELFAYRIVSFVIREAQLDSSKLRVMVTFQNDNKTRTLIDEQISPSKATILSLYSYSYEQ